MFLFMNDISTTRYVIIILDKKYFIIGTINHWTLDRILIHGTYMVVEKDCFVALKNNIIAMLLF